jgi:hypothetical protein
MRATVATAMVSPMVVSLYIFDKRYRVVFSATIIVTAHETVSFLPEV